VGDGEDQHVIGKRLVTDCKRKSVQQHNVESAE